VKGYFPFLIPHYPLLITHSPQTGGGLVKYPG